MGQAIGLILSFAVGVAVSPVPIVAVVLMLVTPRARANGPAFVAGWLAGLLVVGAVVLLVAPDATNDSGGPATWVSVVKLVLGVALLLLALKQWRGRPGDGEEAAMPSWMAAIDSFTASKALGAGAARSRLRIRRTCCSRWLPPRPSWRRTSRTDSRPSPTSSSP